MGPEQHCDVLVIGAGPAGLTAAVYLARYRRRVIVVHDGASRAAHIPLTHNAPGFPGGVEGPELLQRMQAQAELYGAVIQQDHIGELRRTSKGFQASGDVAAYQARTVILATGITLTEIDLPTEDHEAALQLGCLRYCPICDGYEATGKAVGVLGGSVHGAKEAVFLQAYSRHVTLLAREACELSDAQRDELVRARIEIVDTPATGFRPSEDGMEVTLADQRTLRFDVLYPALGAQPRSELAAQLGVPLADGGCIPTDICQRLPVPGLYAAGDVVDGLDQISVALGHGAIAATQAHNFLREQDGRVLQAD